MPRLLYLLALCNLVIGTGAFVLSGILQPLSDALGSSVASTGQAMTVYALATAVLAPLALVLTGRWPRRRALCFGLVVFALGNALCAMSTSLGWLFAGRVLMGMGAVFTPLAAGIAVAVVEPAKRGRALSLVFLGMSMSYVIGVPLGAWLAFRYGWQWPFVLVAGLSLLGVAALMVVLPKNLSAPGASFAGLPALLRQGAVWWTLSLTLLYFMAIFTVFSYIGPVLQTLSPMSHERMSVTLVIFGLAGVAGTLIGGWANDRFGTRRTLTVQMAVLGSMMAVVPFTQGQHTLMVAAFVIWGIAGFGMMTPQQSRLAALAPAQAPLLFSLNTSMLYFGTALGALAGGAFSAPLGMARLAWLGVPLAALGLFTLWMTSPKRAGKAPIPTP
ncbi:MAG: MFS transporter [Rhizobacter sp.]|nr:MFS transporter [Rhizobacter sp.]